MNAPIRPGTLLRQPVAVLAVGVLVIGMLVATTVMQQRRGAPALAAERESLVERVGVVSARASTLRAEVVTAERDLAALQDTALATSARGEEVLRELDVLALISGAVKAVGPGLVVVVDDAPPGAVPVDGEAGGEDGRVQDIDLQQLVNGLWEAGAEAISVDGTRVASYSSIRAAGDALFMDLHPLSAPYEIRAIGDPDGLGARFLDTYGAGWFQVLVSAYGIQYDVTEQESVEVPASTGPDLRWARATPGDPAAGDGT